MEVEQVLHMNGGLGDNSYANNSSLQGVVISQVKPIVEESVIEVYCTLLPECLRIADLGCSSGPNTLTVASEILDTVDAACQCLNMKPPAFQVFLNDLPGNDFNTIFRSLSSFYEKLEKEKEAKFGPCFVAAMPGSFYGRLFPNNSMHFIHSSYSVHFLSQVPKGLVSQLGEPLNKGDIYLSKTSPAEVFKAYFDQYEEDFSLFLRYRSAEMVSGGNIVLTTMGRVDNPNSIYEVVARAIKDMVLEGLIDETKLDDFNLPYYTPTSKEVKKVIQEEGSFILKKLHVFEVDWDAGFGGTSTNKYTDIVKARYDIDDHDYMRAQYVSNYMRAVAEPILVRQFGETIMDDLFRRFTDKVIESMEKENWPFVNLVISLTKKKSPA